MIRNGKWKYVYFVQYPDRPELFDLESRSGRAARPGNR